MNISSKGQISFVLKPVETTICYRKRKNEFEVKDSNYFFLDINSIVANVISFIGKWSKYPKIDNYYHKYVDEQSKFNLDNFLLLLCFRLFEINFNKLYFCSKDNLMQMVLIDLHILSNIKLDEKNEIDLNIQKSINNSIITINYLLNYNKERYLNDMRAQTNESVYSFNNELKDVIVDKIMLLISIKSKDNLNYDNFLSLITFYLNATLDKPLIVDIEASNPTNVIITTLFKLIL